MSRSRADKLGRGIGANTHRHFERIRKAVAVRRGNRELKGFSHRRRAVDAARVSIKAQPAVIGQPVNPEVKSSPSGSLMKSLSSNELLPPTTTLGAVSGTACGA